MLLRVAFPRIKKKKRNVEPCSYLQKNVKKYHLKRRRKRNKEPTPWYNFLLPLWGVIDQSFHFNRNHAIGCFIFFLGVSSTLSLFFFHYFSFLKSGDLCKKKKQVEKKFTYIFKKYICIYLTHESHWRPQRRWNKSTLSMGGRIDSDVHLELVVIYERKW